MRDAMATIFVKFLLPWQPSPDIWLKNIKFQYYFLLSSKFQKH